MTTTVKVFNLKFRDTLPILEVALLNPDGTPFDLTGTTAWKLHIKLNTGTVVTRDMVVQGAPTLGVLRYVWVAADWNAGGLIAGPTPPLKPSEREHTMEYEVISGTSRLTFPNDSYDVLRIVDDLGQG